MKSNVPNYALSFTFNLVGMNSLLAESTLSIRVSSSIHSHCQRCSWKKDESGSNNPVMHIIESKIYHFSWNESMELLFDLCSISVGSA